MKIYKNITELIGSTPIFEPTNLEKDNDLCAKLLLKLEYLNPAGSIKDRAALSMIEDAEEKGFLKDGSVIIEPTSGNTGIGLAAIAAYKGYKVILTMPETMSVERQKLLRAYGAEIVLTSGSDGMQGAVKKAVKLAKEIKNSFIPSQFDNRANAEAHIRTTAPEIYNDTDGQVDIVVAGIGTGGTITGIGEYLKAKNPDIKIIAVEPADSPLLSKGYSSSHKIQGIGANFVPSLLNTSIYDLIVPVTTSEAYTAARELAKREGILVGISSGAALHAAISISKLEENKGKTVVAILPDTGDRYLSTNLFE